MATTFSFNVPIGGGKPTGRVDYNGVGVNFDLSRDRNISNQNAVMTPRDQLNLGSTSGIVSNNAADLNKPSINLSSPNTSNSNQHDLVDYIYAISPLVGAAINYGANRRTNTVNENIASNNQAIVEANNIRNIEFQREENAITRQREDNAFQRAAKDLQLAGLSKTLAAGSPASASALSAPSSESATLDYKYQNPLQGIDMANLALSAMKTMSDIDNNRKLTDAQVSNLNSQARYTNINADTLRTKNESDIAYTKQLTFASMVSSDYQSLQSHFLRKYGDSKELAQLEYVISQRDLNYSNIGVNSAQVKRIAQDVVESMARTENLSYEKQKLLKDIAVQSLNLEILKYDFGISAGLSIRSSDKLPTFFGFPAGAFASALNGITDLKNYADLRQFII